MCTKCVAAKSSTDPTIDSTWDLGGDPTTDPVGPTLDLKRIWLGNWNELW